jgi:tetratricopeptide (TPR) repeat protein
LLGVTERQLTYWERLRLVHPRARWGERFYDFRDLIALRTIQQFRARRVPARRLSRALSALEGQVGTTAASLSAMRAVPRGREVVLVPPAPHNRPIAPLTGQFVFDFELPAGARLRAMASRTPRQWLDLGQNLENDPQTLPRAVAAFQQAALLAPDWPEAWLSLGIAAYQLDDLELAVRAFREALRLEPENPQAHLNLGSVLCELGALEEAVGHLRVATELDPQCADAQLNLALAFEKQADSRAARRQWLAYLRLESEGPWADYARSRLGRPRTLRANPKMIPFRKSE